MSQKYPRRGLLKRVKRIVIKIGSSVLTFNDGELQSKIFRGLAREISILKCEGYDSVIVSSGAISAGINKLGICEKPKNIPEKQAVAAVGQSILMWNYEMSFSKYNQKVAQVLLTHDDLSSRNRYLNARNTLSTLINFGIIPIINENDSVSVEEIKFGDNDNLSALVTNLIGADLLIILTDTNGLYDRNPWSCKDAELIPLVEKICSKIEKIAGDTASPTCIGGMITKVQAAKKAAIFGLPTIVANGKVDGIIGKIVKGESVGTLFLPKDNKITSRKHWIAFTLKPKGEIIIDRGGQDAIVNSGKSLLPSGVLDVIGKFRIGDSVSLVNPDRLEFARGLANYSSEELIKIKGLKTSEVESKLGYKYFDEIIHRDDLVVL
ncbi:MAG: glutamate 5-kinase [Thermodesulfobacteriota bacterium]|nr:glutamate 5-kinase [Thermodesulfobacteriota bacterium]